MNYRVIITSEDFKSIASKWTFEQLDTVKRHVSLNAPDCKIDWETVANDKRCKFFRHYMPANETTAEHSYKRCNELLKSGSNVRVYISKVNI